MPENQLSGWEATEAALPEYERPSVIDWETTPPLARGTQPKDSIPAGIWPGSES